jgi:ABC-type amino acid transport substrate-binding protein
MKTLLTFATLALAGALLAGCQAPTKVLPSHPVSSEVLAQLQAEFAQADAGARVGSVDDVKADVMYVAVGQISGSDFPIGTAVAIIDSNKQVIALGTVKQTFESTVHVKYEKKSGQRDPKVGDAAVKFTEKF